MQAYPSRRRQPASFHSLAHNDPAGIVDPYLFQHACDLVDQPANRLGVLLLQHVGGDLAAAFNPLPGRQDLQLRVAPGADRAFTDCRGGYQFDQAAVAEPSRQGCGCKQ